ncbi:MAG: NTP transferase domain-containing protein, partial [Psychrobium sp.]|nr:NTP transferase domain-containing protein [Psychrobium sp.]
MNKEKSSIIEDQGCIGVVLAGGLSSRMGQDKASLIRNNINMLQFTTQLLNDVGLSKVLVS